eukprot:6676121-Prymnesium_polylepis.1
MTSSMRYTLYPTYIPDRATLPEESLPRAARRRALWAAEGGLLAEGEIMYIMPNSPPQQRHYEDPVNPVTCCAVSPRTRLPDLKILAASSTPTRQTFLTHTAEKLSYVSNAASFVVPCERRRHTRPNSCQ